MKNRWPILLGATWVVASCNSVLDSGFVCTTEARAGITATVVDSATNQPIDTTGVWMRVRDGAYVDSTNAKFIVQPGSQVWIPAAFERKGTYEVTVGAPGYQLWTKAGVVVTADECHVIPVLLTARMAR